MTPISACRDELSPTCSAVAHVSCRSVFCSECRPSITELLARTMNHFARALFLTVLLGVGLFPSVRAQTFPSRSIKVVVPFSAANPIVPLSSCSSARTCEGVRTTGSRRALFAPTTSSSHGSCTPSTTRYRNNSADLAWFCVDAATLRCTAR